MVATFTICPVVNGIACLLCPPQESHYVNPFCILRMSPGGVACHFPFLGITLGYGLKSPLQAYCCRISPFPSIWPSCRMRSLRIPGGANGYGLKWRSLWSLSFMPKLSSAEALIRTSAMFERLKGCTEDGNCA
eukprot:gnl/MRDRNA2_/MRDRNA2_23440_c0_seq1.p2 gnl/MRDRNA2_/MRDRNA2_23440_c0~~gnl/MRDRNA2_/MRDRNA2_23440_c0_seq1.p2  ORF type:complete len:133 (-),score=9.89 gnl/MRDRNA2_/MRDRNA2_23440_c0_seq1:159-557(-)